MSINKSKKDILLEFKSKIILYYRSLQNEERVKDKNFNHIERVTGIESRVISS